MDIDYLGPGPEQEDADLEVYRYTIKKKEIIPVCNRCGGTDSLVMTYINLEANVSDKEIRKESNDNLFGQKIWLCDGCLVTLLKREN